MPTNASDAEPGESDWIVVPIGCGLQCRFPATADAGSMPERGAIEGEPTLEDPYVRMAIVGQAWALLDQFHPDRPEADEWRRSLQRSLRAAAQGTAEELESVVLELVAEVRDGHAFVYRREAPKCRVPIDWDWIDGQLVVTASTFPGVSPGDVVHAVDGQPVARAVAAAERRTSASTPHARRAAALDALRTGDRGSWLRLSRARGAGESPSVVEVPRDRSLNAAFRELIRHPRHGVVYVDLCQITASNLEFVAKELRGAVRVVFDLRGHAPFAAELFRRCLDATVKGPILETRIVRAYHWQDRDLRQWELQPQVPPLRAQVAWLVDARTISASETLLLLARRAGVGRSFGESSAGCNGAMARADLGMGFRMSWTGMRVLDDAGRPIGRKSLDPDVAVRTRLEDVRNRVDPVLRAACDWLESVSR
ncbi:MAG: S41 family peptidase [Planctomycetota bacterium]